MRRLVLTLALAAAATPAAAQQHQHGQGQQHQHGQHHGGQHQHVRGEIPEGWAVRLDRAGQTMEQSHFMEMADHVHLQLGPGGIFYRPTQTASGAYRVSASFTQNAAPAHPEAYGLFVGGRDLEGPGQDYLYFLVRGDGKYLVKHRAGDETHTIVDWTEHAAVQRQDADGKQTNELAIEAAAAHVRFLVNGREVGRLSRGPMLNTDGVVGLRVNHNLDVTVRGFEVQPAG